MKRLLLILLPHVAVAQDFLDPVIVTATRSEAQLSGVPYSATSVSAVDLSENTVRTLPDALRLTPGVLVQKTAHGHGSPFIRGFTGRQNLFLIDGIRFNNATFRSGPVQYWNTVDPLSLDHFELIRSHGSILYGPDAAGGTINAFTKSSRYRDIADGEAFIGGSTYYEYRSNGRGSHVGRIEIDTGIGGKTGLLLGYSAKEYGDIRDSSVGLMRGTGYPEQALDIRIDHSFSPQTTLTLLHQNFNQNNISRWHSTLANPGWAKGSSVTAPGTFIARDLDQERSLTYLRLNHRNEEMNVPIQRITATLSYQTASDSENQIRTLADRRLQSFELRTIGIDLEMESRSGPGQLLYGIDWYRDSVDSTASRNDVLRPQDRPLADDSTYDLLGAYGQYLWEASDKTEITTGVRFTHARASLGRFWNPATMADRSASDSWNNLSASLRASHRLDENWMLFGGLSQAFRAPNFDDLSGNLTARSGTTALGSSDVDPEKFLTAELGIRRSGETWNLSLAAFHTWISDVIVPVPVAAGSTTTVASNGRDGSIHGVEIEGTWRFHPDWTLSGFAAWQEGSTKTRAFAGGPAIDEPFSRMMPLTGSAALRWHHPSQPFWIESRLLAAARADRLSNADRADTQRIPTGGTPGYLVSSLRAGYEPLENLTVTAALENLTDTDHRLHGSGQNEAGLNAIIGLRLAW